ncbi:hypothetical protein HHK36_022486 [Tetracentron sinense]|uniref:RRM domain-containing protein n=1 Tax=Tetracentron sinense TaxID=13715 RepID=A0A834YN26_TETSI|nr:hypothetical protein HHK36_022486 [Tetracentron sinense]
MDSNQGHRMFVGRILSWTSRETLKNYFENYGEVLWALKMFDKITLRPRGYGFVAFADPSVLDRVLQDKHTIDGRTLVVKRALPREERLNSSRSGNPNAGRSFGAGGNTHTKKMFVEGLPSTLTEEECRHNFEAYGRVTDVIIIYDPSRRRSRGFGYISFDSEDAVHSVLEKRFNELNDQVVEIKRALPEYLPGGDGGSMGGGNYQGYGASSTNTILVLGSMDTQMLRMPVSKWPTWLLVTPMEQSSSFRLWECSYWLGYVGHGGNGRFYANQGGYGSVGGHAG